MNSNQVNYYPLKEGFFRNNWILSPLPVAGPGIFPVYNFRGINIGSKQKSRQNNVPGF
jgi:hypothetical protein